MEGNLFQAVAASLFIGSMFGIGVWQLISTSNAKKRRIAREKAAKPGGRGSDGDGI
jgi:hypothetical protein